MQTSRIIEIISRSLKALYATCKEGLDIRDLLVFGGLGMLGYGLWLFRPWIGFSVAGLVLMGIGYLMRDK